MIKHLIKAILVLVVVSLLLGAAWDHSSAGFAFDDWPALVYQVPD